MTLLPESLRALAEQAERDKGRLQGAVVVVFTDVAGRPETMRAAVLSVVGEMSREQLLHDAIEELEHRYLEMLGARK